MKLVDKIMSVFGRNFKMSKSGRHIISTDNNKIEVIAHVGDDNLYLTRFYVPKNKRNNGIGTKTLEDIKKITNKIVTGFVLEEETEYAEKWFLQNGFELTGNKYTWKSTVG